jgi:large subunit ribosomal protein L4
LNIADAKTKNFAAWLKKMGVSKGLIIADTVTKELLLASRNLTGVEVARASHVNVYQIARYPKVIVAKGALDVLNQRVTGAKKEAA